MRAVVKRDVDHKRVDQTRDYLRTVEDYIHFIKRVDALTMTDVLVDYDASIPWCKKAAKTLANSILSKIVSVRGEFVAMDAQLGAKILYISKMPGIITTRPVVKKIKIICDLT